MSGTPRRARSTNCDDSRARHLHQCGCAARSHSRSKDLDQTPDAKVAEWWDTTLQLVQSTRLGAEHLITLADSNAALGSVASPAVGKLEEEVENLAGFHFHRYLLATQQWAPSTFLSSYSGLSGTWTAPSGKLKARRRDYVTTSDTVAVLQQGVDGVVDLTVAQEDHQAVGALLLLPPSGCIQVPTTSNRIAHDPDLFDDPEARAHFVQLLQRAPQIEYATHSSDHTHTLDQYVRTCVETAFPVKTTARGRQPRQGWIQKDTMAAIDQRTMALRQTRQVRSTAAKASRALLFFVWAQLTHNERLQDLHFFGRPLTTLPPTPATVVLSWERCRVAFNNLGTTLRDTLAESAATQLADPTKRRRAKWLRMAHRPVDRLTVTPDPIELLPCGHTVMDLLGALWDYTRNVEGKALAMRELFQLHNTYVIKCLSKQNALHHYHGLADQLQSEWDRHATDKAFATLRRMGAGSKKKLVVQALPVVRGKDGQPATTATQASNIWLSHFGREECAAIVPLEHAQIILDLLPPLQCEGIGVLPEDDVFLLSLADFQTACSSARPSAASLDGITGRLLAAFGPELAELYFPVVVKAILRLEEPQQWKGGSYWQIWKRSGDPSWPIHSRAVMVSPQVGKKFRSLVRTPLADALPSYAGDSQFGGIAGRGVDLAGLAIRTFQNIAELKNTSIMFLLIDVVQAFYKSVRQLVMQTGLSLDHLALLLKTTGLPPTALHRLLERIRASDTSLVMAGVSPHVRALVASSYQGSWFHYPGSSLVAYSTIGTDPGQQLGDVIFNFIMAECMQHAKDQLQHMDLDFQSASLARRVAGADDGTRACRSAIGLRCTVF